MLCKLGEDDDEDTRYLRTEYQGYHTVSEADLSPNGIRHTCAYLSRTVPSVILLNCISVLASLQQILRNRLC